MATNSQIFNISMLLHGRDPALHILRERLFTEKRYLGCSANLRVDLCEVLSDIQREGRKLNYDFVVLSLDMEVLESYYEICTALESLQNQILLRRVLILSIADVAPKRRCVGSEEIAMLREKCSLPIIFGDIRSNNKVSYVAGRILTLASTVLGLRSGVPAIFQY